jgi:hypothetical protein
VTVSVAVPPHLGSVFDLGNANVVPMDVDGECSYTSVLVLPTLVRRTDRSSQTSTQG